MSLSPDSPEPGPAQPGEEPRPESSSRPCWLAIGTYGDSSCAELATHVHCRNCGVYSRASAHLLDSNVPADYRKEWTKRFSAEKPKTEPARGSALLFRIHQEWLALPTHCFQEVTDSRAIHSVPHRRQGVLLGLANVRGELVLCFSLGHALGVEDLPSPDALRRSYHRLLVADWHGNRFGFPVDEVHGTERLHLPDLHPPPVTVAKSASAFTQGLFYWRDRAVGLLNADSLFQSLNQRTL